jgi:hypothetical protein
MLCCEKIKSKIMLEHLCCTIYLCESFLDIKRRTINLFGELPEGSDGKKVQLISSDVLKTFLNSHKNETFQRINWSFKQKYDKLYLQ